MKIALASLLLPSGSKIGVGYQVHYLGNALARRGHEVTVFSACSRPEDALYEARTVPPRRWLRTFGFAWDLRQIDFSGFDVLNAHGDDWFLWGVKRPWHVHTFHGSCLAEMFNIRGLMARTRMGLLALCEQQSIFLSDETVAVSENTRRYVKGIRHVIPCGVDTGRFRPGEVAERCAHPALLFVGTMHGRKRGRMLRDLFLREVRPAVPGAELWCVCEQPPDLPETEGVRFFGRLPEEALVRLFQQAWVFCLPSTYEGFGVPYIEAMASGLPVVATPNPGAVEVLDHGRFGVLAEAEDLPKELIELLRSADARRDRAQAGLRRAEDFAWDAVCERYERLYRREPLDASPPPSPLAAAR
jgi:phosphatidylinositol alpha-mannosyltransferase